MVKIYVEGGGDSKEQQIRCREGFRRLIEKAGFGRPHIPGISAWGGRENSFRAFKNAITTDDEVYPILLVDSEEPTEDTDENPDSLLPWEHLRTRDGWVKPASAAADQAQLMVTCMETWIMADRDAIKSVFTPELNINALLPERGLEDRTRQQVQEALERATKDCGRDRKYQKGKKSFQALAECNPQTLQKHLPYFRRFVATLARHLKREK